MEMPCGCNVNAIRLINHLTEEALPIVSPCDIHADWFAEKAGDGTFLRDLTYSSWRAECSFCGKMAHLREFDMCKECYERENKQNTRTPWDEIMIEIEELRHMVREGILDEMIFNEAVRSEIISELWDEAGIMETKLTDEQIREVMLTRLAQKTYGSLDNRSVIEIVEELYDK